MVLFRVESSSARLNVTEGPTFVAAILETGSCEFGSALAQTQADGGIDVVASGLITATDCNV